MAVLAMEPQRFQAEAGFAWHFHLSSASTLRAEQVPSP